MTPAETAVSQAANIRLEFGDDVLVFRYSNVDGIAWDGCVEEWIGNEFDAGHNPTDLAVEYEGARYYQIGASGGGADVVLLRDDDATVWYLNDFDLTVSLVASDVAAFVALLRQPEE
jgi:hypothetical protein